MGQKPRTDRIFRVDFYPHEWLVSTMSLPPEVRGIYIQIVALIYAQQGPIQNDEFEIGRVSGCSSRMARKVIHELIHKYEKLHLTAEGFVTNSRCESELNFTRTRLEHSAKGGRTKAENAAKGKENKEVASSEGVIHKLPHPTPPHHTPNNINPSTTAEGGSGVFKNGGEVGGSRPIDRVLSDRGRDKAKALAREKNWDFFVLTQEFDQWVKKVGPRNDPEAAFITFIKGKKKQ